MTIKIGDVVQKLGFGIHGLEVFRGTVVEAHDNDDKTIAVVWGGNEIGATQTVRAAQLDVIGRSE